jgi:hypothetical protein
MQISRHFLLAFAVAACLTPALVRAYDNEAQIRARQALEEKMNQVNAQPAAPAAVPTNPAPQAAAAKPAEVAQPAPAAKPAGSQDAVRRALEEKMNQLNAQTPAPAAAPQAAPIEKPAPPAITVTPNNATVENPPTQTSTPGYVKTPSNDNATNDKLSNALRQKMQEVGSQPAETTAPTMATQPPVNAAQAPKYAPVQPGSNTTAANLAPLTEGNYTPVPQDTTRHPNLPDQPTPQSAPTMAHNGAMLPAMNLPALSGPPSPLSPAKQQKIDALNEQYRADQITPQQYHEQRANILAEP